MTVIKKINDLWVEKYRPSSIDDFIGNQDIISFIKDCVEKQSIPHILLHSTSPGTGKNSLVNVILKSIKCNSLIINASEERGIDIVRDKILTFVNSGSFNNKLKIVVLNEADGLTMQFQDSLREIMETESTNCRFIITCNFVNKLIKPIRSRCIEFELKPNIKEIASKIIKILKAENISFDSDSLVSLIKKYYPDIRKIINECQKISKIEKSIIINNEEELMSDKEKCIHDIFDKKNSIKDIQDLIKKHDILVGENIYSIIKQYIFDNHINHKNFSIMVMELANYQYQSVFVVDKDIPSMACILSIKGLLN